MKKQSSKNLQKLLAVNRQINSTLHLDELLGIIMKTAAEVMRTAAASLLLLEPESGDLVFKVALGSKGGELKEKFRVKKGEGIAGWVAEKGRSLVINKTLGDKRFSSKIDKATGFVSKAILCVPMKSKGRVIGVLEAINPRGRKTFSKEDLELFEAFADQAVLSLENARLHELLVREEVSRRELDISHKIQQNFLPSVDSITDLELAAKSIPARQVGGDFYDVIKLNESKIAIMIGDVSGKGVPAALYMVRAISDFRFLSSQFLEAAALLTALNSRLAKDSTLGIFTTFFYLVYDLDEKKLECANAGHLPLVVRRPSGELSFFPPQDALSAGSGLPLGISEDATYSCLQIPLKSGDAFFLYTDGVVEAKDKNGREFSFEKLAHVLTAPGKSARDYLDHVFDAVSQFTQGTEQHDDMTLVSGIVP